MIRGSDQQTRPGAAFSADEYAARAARVGSVMADHDLDGLLLTSPENIYYMIGLDHQGYFAFTMLIWPRAGKPSILTRRMEAPTINQQTPDIEHLGYADDEEPGAAAVAAMKKLGLASGRIAVDLSGMFLSAGTWDDLKTDLPGVEWVDTSRPQERHQFPIGLVDQLRLVKSPAELEYVRKAAAISDIAVQAAFDTAGVGVNEKEVAAAVYEALVLAGSDYPGFAPFVRSTETISQEHSTWRDRLLRRGEKLFVELSGSSARYHAPLSRMGYLQIGDPGAERAQAVAVSALEAVVASLRPGTKTGDVYNQWQQVVDDGLGHSRLRRHHCGYSVGIGYPPSWVGGSTVLGIRRNGTTVVETGMVFHLFSWITDPDLGDYLLSDTAMLGETHAERLTTTPRSLLIE
ncbi:MAG: Xaa-Pro peptidase family protein [Actinobacteria bacterium]|nr:Xaa-Pro peptidase family protein [Actinomycetota bacterium]